MDTEEKGKKMVKPISPEDITTTKEDLIPDEVIEAFNEMIVKKWDGEKSYFKQKEIVESIALKLIIMNEDIEENIFSKGYLDVEKIYAKLGWNVKYESPGWNESFDESFTFTKKGKS